MLSSPLEEVQIPGTSIHSNLSIYGAPRNRDAGAAGPLAHATSLTRTCVFWLQVLSVSTTPALTHHLAHLHH